MAHKSNEEQEQERRNTIDQTTILVILGLAIFFSSLIGVIIAVGLAQHTLDPTGTVTLLGGIFTGLISSLLLLLARGRGKDGPNT